MYVLSGNIGECSLYHEYIDKKRQYYSEYMFDIVDLPDPRWPTYLVVLGALAASLALLIVSLIVRCVWKNKFTVIQEEHNVVLLDDVSGGASN